MMLTVMDLNLILVVTAVSFIYVGYRRIAETDIKSVEKKLQILRFNFLVTIIEIDK